MMPDKKLPEYVEHVLWDHRKDCHAGTGSCGGCVTFEERVAAVLRYGRECGAFQRERCRDQLLGMATEWEDVAWIMRKPLP